MPAFLFIIVRIVYSGHTEPCLGGLSRSRRCRSVINEDYECHASTRLLKHNRLCMTSD